MNEQHRGDNAIHDAQHEPPQASTAESITGHALAQIAAAGVAAGLGTLPVLTAPLAGLLSTLANIPAAERYKARMDVALRQVNATLKDHAQQLREMSDSQYKLMNEAILALLGTTCEAKLQQLKMAIENAATADITPQQASTLARILRDISAAEAVFLKNTFEYEYVGIESRDEARPGIYYVKPGSHEDALVSGLLSLGLLKTTDLFWNSARTYQHTASAAKLLVLLRSPHRAHQN